MSGDVACAGDRLQKSHPPQSAPPAQSAPLSPTSAPPQSAGAQSLVSGVHCEIAFPGTSQSHGDTSQLELEDALEEWSLVRLRRASLDS